MTELKDWMLNIIANFQYQELITAEYYPNLKSVTTFNYLDFLDSVLQTVIHTRLILEYNARRQKHHESKAFYN